VSDVDVPRLEAIAQQLAARVRDEAPDTVARWLHGELPDPADWWRLCFVLACAHPADRGWRQLTEWTRTPEELAVQQAMRRQALINATARANGAGRRRAA
jgi:hypothetical protein